MEHFALSAHENMFYLKHLNSFYSVHFAKWIKRALLTTVSAMSVGETVATWPLFPDKIALINLIHSDIRGNQEVLPFLFPRVAQKKGGVHMTMCE